MHHNPIADPEIADRTYDSVVLDLLLNDHDGLWSVEEVERMLGDATAVADALARLQAVGLIHRLENYVFATRSAAHVHQLAS